MTYKKFIGVLGCIVLLLYSCDNALNPNPENEVIQLKNGNSMVIARDSTLSPELRNHLKSISERLAVSYVNRQNPEQTEIPGELIDYIYNGLVHLYNSGKPKVEEVTNHPLIVATPGSAYEIIFYFYEQKPWPDNWESGNIKTGVERMDQLIDQFNFEIVDYHKFNSIDIIAYAILHSDRPINVYAVGKLFTALPQIDNAGPDGYLTGGRDMEAYIQDKYLVLDITVGWGDCPAGCIAKINRTFRISSNGKVKVIE